MFEIHVLTQKHLEDLRSSGLSDETIRTGKFYSGSDDECQRLLGFPVPGGGLVIPYPCQNGHKPYYRVKPDRAFIDRKGRKSKYLSASKSGCRLYIPACYREYDLKSAKPLIITEGEKKALKGAQDLPGYVVLGLGGVWNFKTEKEHLLGEIRSLRLGERTIFIAYDSDVTSKPEVQQAELALGRELYRLGADVRICRIPQLNGNKTGLDDYLCQRTVEQFAEEILGKASLYTRSGQLLETYDAETYLSKPFERADDLLGGGLLPARGTLVLSAYSKMGKSVLALNIGLCLAAGRTFLLGFEVKRAIRVLYINEEISEPKLQERMQKMIAAAKQSGFNGLDRLRVISRTGIQLDREEGIKDAMRLVRSANVEVVIWDCLYRFHTSNENHAEEMQAMMQKFDYLTRTLGVSHIIIHHHGQPSKDETRTGFQLIRGSSVIGAFGDSYLTLTKYKRNQHGNRYQRAEFTLRNAECPEDMILERNPETLWYEVVKTTPAEGKLKIENVIFTLMEMGGRASAMDLYSALTESYSIGERVARNVTHEAVSLGRIKREKEGTVITYVCLEN